MAKFGSKPRKPLTLKDKFHPLNRQMNRLMVLGNVWDTVTGSRGKFWVLHAVDNDSLVVEVKNPVARHDLSLRKAELLKELNKFFEKPWLKDIQII